MMVLLEKKDYIIYKTKGNKFENLSLKEYPHVIRPYLRDLINEHRPIMELNNNIINSNNNTNNSYNNTNNSNNEENDRAEWKIQLVMQNNFISDKDFEDTYTIFLEMFMGSDTEMPLIHFLIQF